MSIQALSWALAQDIAASSTKFVLVCLANYADVRGICYPSQARLCSDTGQDRKTVQLNITRLVEAGLLRDTGDRIGTTKSIVVFKILGLPESSTRHYVYRTWEPATCHFYIGKRSFDGDPKLDVYRGSGRWVLERLGVRATLVREIVSEHLTSSEALAAEARLLREVENDPLCKNEDTPAKKRAFASEQNRRWTEDREKRDSLDTPLFPGSDPQNGAKIPQKRATEPSVTVKEPSTAGRAARATRLPADWVLPKAWGEWALAERPDWTPENVRKVAEKFKDHWISAPKGTKLDWLATWRNWVRGEPSPKGAVNGAAKPWFLTASGIEAKAKELGIEAPASKEGWAAFRTDVYQRAGVTPEMLKAARQDAPR